MGKLKAAGVSIGVNLVLLTGKIFAAIITGSVGLLAEAAHSLFDLIASILAFLGIKKAQEPEDEDHHYGHDKFENLSSLLQALLIAATAVFVFYEAYDKIKNPQSIEHSTIGIIIMIISVPIAIWTAKYLSKTAKANGGSYALEADSAHFTTDIISAGAVLLGLLIAAFGFKQADPIAAIVVGIIMLWISIKLIIQSYYIFMDKSPDEIILKAIQKRLEKTPDITYHKLKARMAGNKIFADVHIQVNRKFSIVQAHEIAMNLKRKIIREIPEVKEILIHIEPKHPQRAYKRK